MNVEIEGSGDEPASFDASYVKMVRGVNRQMRSYMDDNFEGESFTLLAAKARCFADSTRDRGAVADNPIPCAKLSDLADNVAGSVNATFTGKMVFNPATFTPVFNAKKIVILGKSFKF